MVKDYFMGHILTAFKKLVIITEC